MPGKLWRNWGEIIANILKVTDTGFDIISSVHGVQPAWGACSLQWETWCVGTLNQSGMKLG